MPSVNVVLRNGTAIEVDGANDAEWMFDALGGTGQQRSLLLIVFSKQPNKTETRGKFLATEVAGFTIDVR